MLPVRGWENIISFVTSGEAKRTNVLVDKLKNVRMEWKASRMMATQMSDFIAFMSFTYANKSTRGKYCKDVRALI